MNTVKTSIIALLALSAGAATAEPIYIDTHYNQDADADTRTLDFNNLGLFPDATSVYTGGDIADGFLNPGDVLSFTDTGNVDVASLNPLTGVSHAVNREGFDTTWGLTATYTVSGTSTYIGTVNYDLADIATGTQFLAGEGFLPSFVNGTLEFFLVNPSDSLGSGANGLKVLELDLTAGNTAIANVILNGIVDYSWYTAAGNADQNYLVENMFRFSDGTSFFARGSGVNVGDVVWRNDFNVDPNLVPRYTPSNYDPSEGTSAQPCGVADAICRTSNLNMTVRFDVPEPGSVALLGIGLLGFAASRRQSARLGA